ncbi:HAD family hydrolase [Pyxidicoccus sp. 3LG]
MERLLRLLVLGLCLCPAVALAADPLPSWNDGPVKRDLIAFVERVTREGSPDFIPPEERIAVFDNDGTLWQEQPVVQGAFVLERLKALAKKDPSLRQRQPYKAALAGDLAYFKDAGEAKVMELFAATHAGMPDAEFQREVSAFFEHARHPKLGVPYTQLAYQPMLELLQYLRAQGFQTWISSGGGIDFMRAVSEQMYGIPPEQVIGSSLEKKFVERGDERVLMREPKADHINDKEGKPVGIDLHVGLRPVFAAGNVRSGGDISMLEYSQGGARPSFQLLINHDDAEREFAYEEKDGASLKAARRSGWHVVSMRQDWRTVFEAPR